MTRGGWDPNSCDDNRPLDPSTYDGNRPHINRPIGNDQQHQPYGSTRVRRRGFIGDVWIPLDREDREIRPDGRRLWDRMTERDVRMIRNAHRTMREIQDMEDSDDDSIPPLYPPSPVPVYPPDIAAGGTAVQLNENYDGETDDD